MLEQGYIDGLLLFSSQRAHTPFGQFPEGQRADRNPHQAQYIHAKRRQHSPDMTVPTLV
jgi:hypothetical protein